MLRGVQGGPLGGNTRIAELRMYCQLGYYFDSLKWLGVETEVFNATPHVKQQNLTIGGFDFGTAPGLNFRVLTWAPVNIAVRYQAERSSPTLEWG